jgi:hypothetical protein
LIKKKFYGTRDDGVNLYQTYSDEGKRLIRNDGEIFDNAVDVENTEYTYIESEEYIDIVEEVME